MIHSRLPLLSDCEDRPDTLYSCSADDQRSQVTRGNLNWFPSSSSSSSSSLSHFLHAPASHSGLLHAIPAATSFSSLRHVSPSPHLAPVAVRRVHFLLLSFPFSRLPHSLLFQTLLCPNHRITFFQYAISLFSFFFSTNYRYVQGF